PRWLGLLHVVSPRTQRARARHRSCDDLNGGVFRSADLDHTSYARRARLLHRCDGACACELNMRLPFTALAVGGACSGALASSAARSLPEVSGAFTQRNRRVERLDRLGRSAAAARSLYISCAPRLPVANSAT